MTVRTMKSMKTTMTTTRTTRASSCRCDKWRSGRLLAQQNGLDYSERRRPYGGRGGSGGRGGRGGRSDDGSDTEGDDDDDRGAGGGGRRGPPSCGGGTFRPVSQKCVIGLRGVQMRDTLGMRLQVGPPPPPLRPRTRPTTTTTTTAATFAAALTAPSRHARRLPTWSDRASSSCPSRTEAPSSPSTPRRGSA